jgi:hypothetical protein
VEFGLEAISRRLVFIAQQIDLMLHGDWKGVLKSSEQFKLDLEAAADAAGAAISALINNTPLPKPKTTGDEETGGLPFVPPKPIKPAAGGAGGGGKGNAEKEAEALKKRGEQLTASVDLQEAYNQKMREYDELLGKGAITQATFEKAVAAAHEQLTAAGDALTASVDPAFAYELAMRKINQAYMDGSIEIETWLKLQAKAKEEMDKQKGVEDPMKALKEGASSTIEGGIKGFFKDIIEGSKTAGEAFANMVKSIISELAKLLAEFAAKQAAKFIISAITGGGGGGKAAPSSATALATMPTSWNAVGSLAATPFGPTSSGVGVAQTGGQASASPWQVVINNNAPGVDVRAMPRGDGALEVTVERVRALMSQDVARGGNAFARSLESAYGLGRAR